MNQFFGLISLIVSMEVFAGTADTIQVYSPSMKKEIHCVVILPSGYGSTGKLFPVLYLLHGYGSNYTQWLNVAPQLKDKTDELGMLIVCPDGGFGSWYLDNPLDSAIRYETFISKELIPFIDTHYKTIHDRQARAISGISMGGHGGLYLGIRHRDIFGAAGSISGVVDFPNLHQNRNGGAGGNDSVCCGIDPQINSVMKSVEDLKNGDLKLIFDCGVSDFLVHVNRILHQKLLNKKIDHDYAERPGRHNAAYWRNSIDYQLLFFKKFFEEKNGLSN